MAAERAGQEALRYLNNVFADIVGREPRWAYYSSLNTKNASRKKDRYFYTTERVRWQGKVGFQSGVRRYYATRKGWIALKVVTHKHRADAKARALKLRNKEAAGITTASATK